MEQKKYFIGIGLASSILFVSSFFCDIKIPAGMFIIYSLMSYFALGEKY